MKTIFNTRNILLLAGILFSSLTFAQQNDYKKELDIIFSAFQEVDYETLKPVLDPNVKIAEKIPTGMNDLIIPQILLQLPVPDSYTILKTETIGENRKITTEYSYSGGNKRLQFFTFNKEGKVIDLDILSDASKVETEYRTK